MSATILGQEVLTMIEVMIRIRFPFEMIILYSDFEQCPNAYTSSMVLRFGKSVEAAQMVGLR